MAYQNYQMYPSMYPQPYQDRLAQLQNQYQQTVPQIPAQQPQVNQGLLWVSGEIGAKSYLVAPNTTVLLMDSEDQKFYLKSTDVSGMPSMRVFEYREVVANSTQNHSPIMENMDDKYVTRNEYNSLLQRYDELINRFDSFRGNSSADDSRKQQKQEQTERRGGNVDEQSDI